MAVTRSATRLCAAIKSIGHMLRTQPRQVELQEETALVCDRCGRLPTGRQREIAPDEVSEWSEAMRIRFTGGYGSVFGDGARVLACALPACAWPHADRRASREADLCQHCVKELIGPFCRVLPTQGWATIPGPPQPVVQASFGASRSPARPRPARPRFRLPLRVGGIPPRNCVIFY